MDKGEQFCLNLSIVDDTVGEDSEQFEMYLENIIPSELATTGANDTVCITIQKNDGMYILIISVELCTGTVILCFIFSITPAAEFCPSESVVVEGVEYHWPKTPASAVASAVCQNNPRFSVMRNCNAFGNWQLFDPADCGTLSNQLREIRNYLEVSSTSSL